MLPCLALHMTHDARVHALPPTPTRLIKPESNLIGTPLPHERVSALSKIDLDLSTPRRSLSAHYFRLVLRTQDSGLASCKVDTRCALHKRTPSSLLSCIYIRVHKHTTSNNV